MMPACCIKFCSISAILLLAAGVLSQSEKYGVNSVGAKLLAAPKSPVAKLRQLLTMSRDEQEQFLSNKSDLEKQEILALVDEYKALRPDERELKLKATELRWYLRPFISAPETNRAELLSSVPVRDRKLVQDRLRYWDQLPVEEKKRLQTNQAVEIYFSLPVEQRIFAWATNSENIQEAIQKLQAMPEDQRQRTLNGFYKFFDFTSNEKEKIMQTVVESERQQMKKVLDQYEHLPEAQRVVCIQSFEKFKRMTSVEQQQFLRNAELWRRMTPTERQQWKNLVEEFNALPPSPAPEFPGPVPGKKPPP